MNNTFKHFSSSVATLIQFREASNNALALALNSVKPQGQSHQSVRLLGCFNPDFELLYFLSELALQEFWAAKDFFW